MDPLQMAKDNCGKEVAVHCTCGDVLRGVLVAVDEDLNVALRGSRCVARRHSSVDHGGDAAEVPLRVVRGDAVKYIGSI